jgi:adenosylhomocysteine nucleosidase
VLGTEFLSGTIDGHKVVVACCGIGKVNAAACATYLLFVKGCDAIVNVGIAGGVAHGLHTLDVVISRELCFHDQDAVMLKYFPARQFFDGDLALRQLCAQVCSQPGMLVGSWREGRIATGDKFVADSATRDAIIAAVAPDCVEMEGAAIAHVAYAAGKPCLVIRTMSDCADDDATTTYDNFLERAANQSARIVLAMLRHAD